MGGRTPENFANPKAGYLGVLDPAAPSIDLGPTESGYLVSTYNSTATGTQGDPHNIVVPLAAIGLRYSFMLPGNKYVNVVCGDPGDTIDINEDLNGASLLGIPSGQTCVLEVECATLTSWRVTKCLGTVYMDDDTVATYAGGAPVYFDNRTDLYDTGSIAGSGTHTHEFAIGASIQSGLVEVLTVALTAGASADTTIEFYDADPAGAGAVIYQVLNHDFGGSNLSDRNVWFMELQAANSLWLKVTNDAVTAVTLDIGLRIKGD